MRVLVVEPSGGLWGSERALLDLLSAVSGTEIAVCCPSGTPLEGELRRLGVTVFPVLPNNLHRGPRWRRLVAAVGVLRACRSFRPSVIHLNQCGIYRVALPAARLLGLPMLGHVRIFEDAAYLAGRSPDPRHLAGLVAISEAVADEIRALPALAAIPVHTLYDAYRRAPAPAVAPPRDDRHICCAGRLVPIKGQDVLLRALAVGGDRFADVTCRIVGDGDAAYRRALEGLATGVTATVRWTGFVDDVLTEMRGCRLVVCPSHREPLGRVVLEAWDAGALPVVHGGSGGAAEIVQASGGGLLYAPQEPGSLADALAAGLALPRTEIDARIAAGRAWMAEHCDPAAYSRRTEALWRSLGTARS